MKTSGFSYRLYSQVNVDVANMKTKDVLPPKPDSSITLPLFYLKGFLPPLALIEAQCSKNSLDLSKHIPAPHYEQRLLHKKACYGD